MANVSSERKQALVKIIRKSSSLLSVSEWFSSQKKKIVFAANFPPPIFYGHKAEESAKKNPKWLNVFSFRWWRSKKEGCSFSFSLLTP